MQQKMYYLISGTLFAVVAIAHACRLVLGWEIAVDAVTIPMWVSWVGFVVPGVLAPWAFYLLRRAG